MDLFAQHASACCSAKRLIIKLESVRANKWRGEAFMVFFYFSSCNCVITSSFTNIMKSVEAFSPLLACRCRICICTNWTCNFTGHDSSPVIDLLYFRLRLLLQQSKLRRLKLILVKQQSQLQQQYKGRKKTLKKPKQR